MSWMINLTGILITSTMTGSIAFAIWFLFRFLVKKWGRAEWCRWGLWVTVLLYVCPIVYIGMMWCSNKKWSGVLFWPTQIILNVCGIVILIWSIGMGMMCCKLLSEALIQYRRYRGFLPCEKEIQIVFDRVCREMQLDTHRIVLCQDYRAEVPSLMGILQPKVVLPVQKFTKEQLRVVFFHELTHYRQRDLYLNLISTLVRIVHWFNPLVWLLAMQIRQWCEYVCDAKVCRQVGGRKRYFDVIFDVMCVSYMQKGVFCMHMVENVNELIRRKKYMRELERTKKKPVIFTVLLSAMLIMTCSITVLAAADSAGKQYEKWYRMTEVAIKEELTKEPVYEEFYDNGPEESIRIEFGETGNLTRSLTEIEWSIGSNTLKKTSGFSVNKGKKICVNIYISPANKNVSVGIIDSSGTRRYVTGKDSISYNFEITKTDTYRVFVENKNTTSVNVEGSYTVR